MPARTIKGPLFTINVAGQQVIVKHVACKGKRCRVIFPEGVTVAGGIEASSLKHDSDQLATADHKCSCIDSRAQGPPPISKDH